MLKAIFLDMDETLCDTTKANIIAKDQLTEYINSHFPDKSQAEKFTHFYLEGIYKNVDEDIKKKLFPIRDEEYFRTQLVHIYFERCGALKNIDDNCANDIRQKYDQYRIQAFDFFPGCQALLKDLRQQYKLVVITNGPVYSQVPKVERIKLENHVDHVIIGGQEPEEKPHKSIFSKALKLADAQAHECLHVGDSINADIIGANNSGIKSVWINAAGGSEKSADFSIRNIIELPEVIAQL